MSDFKLTVGDVVFVRSNVNDRSQDDDDLPRNWKRDSVTGRKSAK